MKKYFDLVEIGDKIQILEEKPVTRLQIAQFAAATEDFSPLNLDDEFARNAGFMSAFAPGIIPFGLAHRAIIAFASNINVISLSATFQRLIRPGDKLKVQGLILRRYKKNDEHRISIELWCENQNQEVVMKASSVCLLFKNEQDEKQSKSHVPLVSKKSKSSMENKFLSLAKSHNQALKPQLYPQEKELV